MKREVFVRRLPEEPVPLNTELALTAGTTLLTGEASFRSYFANPTSLELDLLLIASSIFAADRALKRGHREQYQRFIRISIPVINLARLLPIREMFEQTLRTLTQDAWEVALRGSPGSEETPRCVAEGVGHTILFSGGLDSLAAAIEFGRNQGPVALVSHTTRGPVTRTVQSELATALAAAGMEVRHHQFLVSSTRHHAEVPNPSIEESQRTRSFLFLVLAALTARRLGHPELLMIAENGQLAVHLPMTQARIGAFSTHTAHPDFLARMEALLSEATDWPLRITNPYVYKTKAEVVSVVRAAMPTAIPIAISCWRSSRLPASANHCGECIPCYIRRIALEFGGVDPTRYARDPWIESLTALSENDTGRRNLVDLCEFMLRFRAMPDADILCEWPELYSEEIDASLTMAMYRKAANECFTVLQRYPAVKDLLL